MRQNLPIWTATQSNRAVQNSSDMGLENTSESFGVPAAADFMFALISTEELQEMNQMIVKQLGKNRYGDPTMYRRFLIGVDRKKMRLYDLTDKAQEDLHDHSSHNSDDDKDDTPLFDKSPFGQSMKAERKDTPVKKFDKSKFGKIK